MSTAADQLDAALSLLTSTPVTQAWDTALGVLRAWRLRDVDTEALAAIEAAPCADGELAGTAKVARYLTARAIALTVDGNAADMENSTAFSAHTLGRYRLTESANDASARVELTELAGAVASAARSLARLRGPVAQLRELVWIACFGESLYAAWSNWQRKRDQPVMVLGETGTGKELVAETLACANIWLARTLGLRPDHRRPTTKPVVFSAANIPESLADRELFGHVKDAFTGAATDSAGYIEHAHGRALFLDEIGDLPLILQPKLLRVVQYHTFNRLGSTTQLTSQPRWITATSRDVPRMLELGRFQRDLYERLAQFVIEMPAMRDWEEQAVHDFARDSLAVRPVAATKSSVFDGRPRDCAPNDPGIGSFLSGDSLDKLTKRFDEPGGLGENLKATRRKWPGNVRELETIVNTWRMDGTRVALKRLDCIPVHEPARHPTQVQVPAAYEDELHRRVLAGSAKLDEVKLWYATYSARFYKSQAEQARRILADESTLTRHKKAASVWLASPPPDESAAK